LRGRAKLSQKELGERLGVSGNYISMIELGKKSPGATLRKLFESIEQSLPSQVPVQASGAPKESLPAAAGVVHANSLFSLLSTETLIRTFTEVAGKLSQSDLSKQKQVIGNLWELLNEMEQRLPAGAGSGPGAV
jgi:transcriptional regulator with XRE-family HTH domain